MCIPLKIAEDYVPSDLTGPVLSGLTHRLEYLNKKEAQRPGLSSASSLLESAREAGLRGTFFHQLSHRDPKQFRAISLLGRGDLAAGYVSLQSLKKKVAKAFLESIENRNMAALDRLAGMPNGCCKNLKKTCQNGTLSWFKHLLRAKKIMKVCRQEEKRENEF